MSYQDLSHYVTNFPLYYSIKNKYTNNTDTANEDEFKKAIDKIFKDQSTIQVLNLICMHHNLSTNKAINTFKFNEYDNTLKLIVIDYATHFIN